MLCPACQKSQPLSFRCGNCGAQMMQGSYQTAAGPPLMDDVVAPIPVTTTTVTNDNPYQAPRSTTRPRDGVATTTDVLAGRGARLAAVLIDYVCMVAVSIPGFAGFLYVESGASTAAGDLAPLALVMGLGILTVVQGIYIVRDGQTIGKKMMKIRIVDHIDGTLPGWPRILGMRYILNTALRQIPFYFLVDAVLIFGEEQRCIHDHLAGTKVIEA